MNYYVTIKHPITGDAIQVVPTGKTRTEERGREEIEGKVITPKARLDTVWFCKEDVIWNSEPPHKTKPSTNSFQI